MNIQEILKNLGVDYKEKGEHHHTTEGWVSTDCPSCSPGSKTYRLGISEDNLAANCWSCGKVWVVEALARLSGRPFPEVKALVEQVRGKRPEIRQEARGRLLIPKGVKPLGEPHRAYLKGRGLDPDEVATVWGVQGIGLSSKLAWRLFIPVHLNSEMVSWTTRSIGAGHGLRYRSAGDSEESVPHRSLLYGEDLVRHALIVCEGPVDAWSIGPGAVCTFGTAYSQRQMMRMTKYPLRVICFDAEAAAQRRASKLCDDLAAFPGRTINVVLGSGKDANSTTEKERKELRKFLC